MTDRQTFPPILLLRHGQTDWNAIRRIQGQRESDLTETGRGHAACQGEILAGMGDVLLTRALWCSPLRRTRQTAEIAFGPAYGRVRHDDRLKEIFMGDWEGWLYADLPSRWPEEAARWTTTFDRCVEAPGGEGFDSLMARAQSFLDDLDGPAVIVAHGVINMAIRGIILGLDRDGMADLEAEQGVVLRLEDGREEVLR
jgi:broad specificity phosphatase PhoE